VGATAEPSIGEKLAGLVKGREADVLAFLIARGQLKENGSLDDLPPEYAARILGNPIGFLEAVEKFNAEVTPIA
jgi:hypothetical protein